MGRSWGGSFNARGRWRGWSSGTPRKLLDQPQEQLRHWLIAVPHLTLDQLQQKLGEDCGVQISRAQVASQDLRGRLFAEWDTKREESRAMRATLRTDDFWRFSHLFPDLHRRCIHIEKSYLLATLSPMAIDADCRQEARLSRLEQVRSHTDGRSILNVLNVIRTLRDDLVVQIREGLIRDEAAQKII
jgi:hypothetical protein